MADFRFDGWTLKRDSGELTRDGRTTRLPPQPFEILDMLLSNAGEVVSREALVARLWPTGIVDFDTALNTAVRRLRSALGDDAETPRYIETLPRRGYRFIAPLDPPPALDRAAGPAPVPAATRSAWLHPLAVGAAIACLLAVTWMTVDVPRSEGERPLAPASPSGPAAMTLVELTAAAPEAAQRYHYARFLLQRRGPGDLARAREYFQSAVDDAPAFAPGHAGLASVQFLQAVLGETARDVGFARARAAAERALSLDPRSAEAHMRLALVTRDRATRIAHVQRARAADPSHALVLGWLASEALAVGDFAAGAELQRQAAAAEPLNLAARYNLAVVQFLAGRYEDVRRTLRDLYDVNPGFRADVHAHLLIAEEKPEQALALVGSWQDDVGKRQILALALHRLGRTADAERALERLIEIADGKDPLRVAEVYAYRGELERAFEWLDADPPAAQAPGTSPAPRWLVQRSPFVASLHEDARWERWLATRE